jgi:HK97 family phage portal protein
MDAAFAEIENADPLKSVPGKSGTGYQEAALEHFIFESRGSTDRYRPYSTDKALTYSAVWACGRIISSSLSMIDWDVFKGNEDGKGKNLVKEMERSAAGDVAYFLNWAPNDEQSSMDWRQTAALDVLFEGNAYTFIDKNGGDRVQSLWRLDPKRVTPFRADGDLYYHVKNGHDKPASILTPSELLHFRGLSPDGLVGYSVLAMARRTVELGLSQEGFGQTFFQRGPMPGGVLTIPNNIDNEKKTQLRNDIERLYGGAENAGRVLVLGGNQTFTKMDLNNTDAQFLESRRFSIEDVSRWFGVPPHKLADLTRATFSNIEHQAIEFVVDCLMPWARRFESEVDLKLFGRVNRGKFWTKHDFQEFLKGDSTSLTTSLSQQVNGGMRTPNEARERLDLNPIKGGDTPLIQGAMIPLERAIEEPKPPAAPVAPQSPTLPPDESEEEDDAEPAAKALRRLIVALRNESKTATEVVVVAGPPAAGKSTWVESERKTGDIVVDWDSLRASLLSGPRRGGDLDCLDIIAGARDGACDAIRDGLAAGVKHPRCFIIRGLPNGEDRAKFAADFGAKQMLLLCDESTSVERIQADDGRKEYEAEQIDAVKRWHSRFTSHAGDIVVRTDREGESDSPPSNLAAPVRLLFQRECDRLMRVESDKARRADNRGKLDEWRKDYYRDHASVSAQYLPTVQAALTAFGSTADPQKLSDFIAVAHNRLGSTSEDLLESLTDKEWPTSFATECVNLLWKRR